MERRANILLVDDKPERLLSYEAILSTLGHNLVSASSGEEALRCLMQGEYAAILLDVNMPGMNGFEVAALIRDHPRFEKTPIIFVTGVHMTHLDRLRGYQMGAVDYVYIPVVPEILRGKIQVLVQLHLQQQELTALNEELAAANAELAEAHRVLEAENRHEQDRLNRNLEQANLALAEANQRLVGEVAERTRAEQLLQEDARRKDEFLAVLAHELRNPLAAIRTGLQVLRESSTVGDRETWVHEMLERQMQYLVCLIDDLLDVSRVTHGRVKLQPQRVELGELLQHTVQAVRSRAEEAGLSLRVELERECWVDGDPVRIAQVVDNLLTNAMRYTPRGGRIAVTMATETTVTGDDEWVRIDVADSGVGIPPDMLERVFEVFVQAPHKPREDVSGGGLGIGLALVRGLVELHRGTVVARSPGAGQGTVFTVRLPLRTVHAAVNAEIPDRPKLSESLRVLIVDDNVDSSMGLSICLESSGHEVRLSHDGETGVAAALEMQPDVILLDIGLPDVDGREVARRLRRHEALQQTPLIAISGFGAADDRRAAAEAGFNSYLVKPVSIEALEATLSEQMERVATG